MKRLIHLALLLALGAMSSAQSSETGSAVVRKVEIVPANGTIRVEVTLSATVTPSVEIARRPDRWVRTLPGTVSETRQTRIAVGQLGVKSVRFGLNRPNPPETHLVVDIDSEHPYKVLTDGTKIILVVEEPLSISARRRAGPAAAASGPLLSLGHKSPSDGTHPGTQDNSNGSLLTPPPSGPPIAFPRARSSEAATTSE